MFKRIDELIDIHNLKHEIKEKDDSIWYIINGFKECPGDTKTLQLLSIITRLTMTVTGDDKYG